MNISNIATTCTVTLPVC